MDNQRTEVPVRTIAATIGMLLATGAAVWLLVQLHQVLVWLVVAGFFAIILSPLVGFLQRRARMPRPVATLTALVVVFAVIAGIVTVLVRPLIGAVQPFIQRLPAYVQQAQNGEGPIGNLLRRFNVVQRVQANLDSIQGALRQLGDPALNVVLTAGSLVVGIVVVLVLTFLLILEGPKLTSFAVSLLPERHRDRAQRVLREAGHAVTGYVGGQLLIATLCGGVTYIVLAILGVPFRNVVALFVGLVDLIPVVGATIGGLLAVGVAFLHSITAGIVMLVFFLVYQQLENHLLQPFIQARTVHLNALAVLISVLIGVELAGILGALLAIPAAGIIQVVIRDLWRYRRARLAVTETGSGGGAGSDADPSADTALLGGEETESAGRGHPGSADASGGGEVSEGAEAPDGAQPDTEPPETPETPVSRAASTAHRPTAGSDVPEPGDETTPADEHPMADQREDGR